MSFVCPRCGSTTYKVGGDGIRECTGTVVDSLDVALVKSKFAAPDALVAAQPPTVQHRHERRCPTWWEEVDDGKYGVAGEVAKP
jgi:hypothetical protein